MSVMARRENKIFDPGWVNWMFTFFLLLSIIPPSQANEATNKYKDLD